MQRHHTGTQQPTSTQLTAFFVANTTCKDIIQVHNSQQAHSSQLSLLQTQHAKTSYRYTTANKHTAHSFLCCKHNMQRHHTGTQQPTSTQLTAFFVANTTCKDIIQVHNSQQAHSSQLSLLQTQHAKTSYRYTTANKHTAHSFLCCKHNMQRHHTGTQQPTSTQLTAFFVANTTCKDIIQVHNSQQAHSSQLSLLQTQHAKTSYRYTTANKHTTHSFLIEASYEMTRFFSLSHCNVVWNGGLCAWSRYQGQGQVITSHRYGGCNYLSLSLIPMFGTRVLKCRVTLGRVLMGPDRKVGPHHPLLPQHTPINKLKQS